MQTKPQVIYKDPAADEVKPQGPRIVRLPRKPMTDEMGNPPPADIVAEVQKEGMKEEIKQKEKVEELVRKSHTILYKCSSVFPFDLFPDEVSIEATSVNIKKKSFFLTDQLSSVPIKNISDVIVNSVPFFATIRVVDQFFAQNTFKVSFIKKREAEKTRRIIQGLVILSKENVDTAKMEPKELVRRAEELGKMKLLESAK